MKGSVKDTVVGSGLDLAVSLLSAVMRRAQAVIQQLRGSEDWDSVDHKSDRGPLFRSKHYF